MDILEIEVKFYLKDLQTIREKIMRLGAISQNRFFETNIRFEDRDKTLYAKKALLRLRRDNRVSLTYKSEPKDKDSNFKVYRELEVEVGDFRTMEKILNSLGFYNAQVYEKYRETILVESTRFCLDEMPFGNFLEIEGEKHEIMKMVEALNLDWGARILTNYLHIFEILREKENLPFQDLTFENFEKTPLDFSRYLALFTARQSEGSENER